MTAPGFTPPAMPPVLAGESPQRDFIGTLDEDLLAEWRAATDDASGNWLRLELEYRGYVVPP